MKSFEANFEVFGWYTQVIDGNSMGTVFKALTMVKRIHNRPAAMIAQTKKGLEASRFSKHAAI